MGQTIPTGISKCSESSHQRTRRAWATPTAFLRGIRRALALLLSLNLLLTLGCSGNADEVQVGSEVDLLIWNRSQFQLHEIRTHPDVDYTLAANHLMDPLEPEAEIQIQLLDGEYVTAIRPRLEVSSEALALTTADRIWVGDGDYTLIVFDESFRLVAN